LRYSIFEVTTLKKALLLLLDSVGIGALPDAADYGDAGAATVPHLLEAYPDLAIPNLRRLGLCSIDSMTRFSHGETPDGIYCRCASASRGKDSIVGHWEIMGAVTQTPFLTFPDGFPQELLAQFCERCGIAGVLGNCAESGTEIIARLGAEHQRTGLPIVYTSADSVFQIAAHEDTVPIEMLYRWCEAARQLFDESGIGIGRVIARPFVGTPGHYTRTARRHDYAAVPAVRTDLERLCDAGIPVHSVGKPYDIFSGAGFTSVEKTENNADGLAKALRAVQSRDGLIFANILDFDMVWGHRRNAPAYANGLVEVDAALPALMEALGDDGLLIVTADHGCDPTYRGTDHTREYIPALLWHRGIRPRNAGTRAAFADIGATLLDWFGVPPAPIGQSIFD
jgi:phosphopentomutase